MSYDHATATLSGSISATNLSLTLGGATPSADTLNFPVNPFSAFYIIIDSEIIQVTGVSASPFITWTIVRGCYNTIADAHNGSTIYNAARSGAFLNYSQLQTPPTNLKLTGTLKAASVQFITAASSSFAGTSTFLGSNTNASGSMSTWQTTFSSSSLNWSNAATLGTAGWISGYSSTMTYSGQGITSFSTTNTNASTSSSSSTSVGFTSTATTAGQYSMNQANNIAALAMASTDRFLNSQTSGSMSRYNASHLFSSSGTDPLYGGLGYSMSNNGTVSIVNNTFTSITNSTLTASLLLGGANVLSGRSNQTNSISSVSTNGTISYTQSSVYLSTAAWGSNSIGVSGNSGVTLSYSDSTGGTTSLYSYEAGQLQLNRTGCNGASASTGIQYPFIDPSISSVGVASWNNGSIASASGSTKYVANYTGSYGNTIQAFAWQVNNSGLTASAMSSTSSSASGGATSVSFTSSNSQNMSLCCQSLGGSLISSVNANNTGSSSSLYSSQGYVLGGNYPGVGASVSYITNVSYNGGGQTYTSQSTSIGSISIGLTAVSMAWLNSYSSTGLLAKNTSVNSGGMTWNSSGINYASMTATYSSSTNGMTSSSSGSVGWALSTNGISGISVASFPLQYLVFTTSMAQITATSLTSQTALTWLYISGSSLNGCLILQWGSNTRALQTGGSISNGSI